MYAADLLAGQSILITGGGTGLGKAMALRMASLGAKVGISGRRAAPLLDVVAEIEAAGGQAAAVQMDVRDPASVKAGVDALEATLGPLTGLVNNAAGNFLCASEDLTPNAFNSVVQIVLYGTFHCTTELGRRWIARDSGGSVLNILTTYAWMGSGFVMPSAAAKAGVLAMTRSLAVEWATYRIRCNGIAPGPFPTEGAFSRLMAGGMEEAALKRIPAGRFGEPTELADLAVYLMAPRAAYITGEVVTIDGGEWLKGGQEFSGLTDLPRDELKAALSAMRPGK
jgi:NAD(P)-dependent dehydrogenase (short-subunit alcohol dehydrogenase family)